MLKYCVFIAVCYVRNVQPLSVAEKNTFIFRKTYWNPTFVGVMSEMYERVREMSNFPSLQNDPLDSWKHLINLENSERQNLSKLNVTSFESVPPNLNSENKTIDNIAQAKASRLFAQHADIPQLMRFFGYDVHSKQWESPEYLVQAFLVGGNNPFFKLFSISILIAGLGYDEFFKSGVLPFVSPLQIMSNPKSAMESIRAMCQVEISPQYVMKRHGLRRKKKLFFVPEHKRKVIASTQPELFLACDYLIVLVQSLAVVYGEYGNRLKPSRTAYEPGLDGPINSIRLQSRTCPHALSGLSEHHIAGNITLSVICTYQTSQQYFNQGQKKSYPLEADEKFSKEPQSNYEVQNSITRKTHLQQMQYEGFNLFVALGDQMFFYEYINDDNPQFYTIPAIFTSNSYTDEALKTVFDVKNYTSVLIKMAWYDMRAISKPYKKGPRIVRSSILNDFGSYDGTKSKGKSEKDRMKFQSRHSNETAQSNQDTNADSNRIEASETGNLSKDSSVPQPSYNEKDKNVEQGSAAFIQSTGHQNTAVETSVRGFLERDSPVLFGNSPKLFVESLLLQVSETSSNLALFTRSEAMVSAMLNLLSLDPMSAAFFSMYYILTGNGIYSKVVKMRLIASKVPLAKKIIEGNSQYMPRILRSVVTLWKKRQSKRLTKNAEKILSKFIDEETWRKVNHSLDFTIHPSAMLYASKLSTAFVSQERKFLKGIMLTSTVDDTETATSIVSKSLPPFDFGKQTNGILDHAKKAVNSINTLGLPKFLSKKLNSGKTLGEDEDLSGDLSGSKIISPWEWPSVLNDYSFDAFSSLLDHEVGQATLHFKTWTGALLRNTWKRLSSENIRKHTIFSATLIKPARKKTAMPILALKRSVEMFMRTRINTSTDGMWFGVMANLDNLVHVALEIHKVYESLNGVQDESDFLFDAFMNLEQKARERSCQLYKRVPPGTIHQFGFPLLNPRLAEFHDEDVNEELQISALCEHQPTLLRTVVGFVMQTLQNSKNVKKFEKQFATSNMMENMAKPEYLNNARLALNHDIMLGFYNRMLPSAAKNEVKQFRYGKTLYFTGVAYLAGQVHLRLNNKHLGSVLVMQAPYLGGMIEKYRSERSTSVIKAVFGAAGIAFITAYTMFSMADLLNQAIDIGVSPPPPRTAYGYGCVFSRGIVTCFDQAEIPTLAQGPEAIVANQATLVGLWSGAGAVILPLGLGIAAYNIIKSRFQIVQRLETLLFAGVNKIFRKLLDSRFARKIRNLFKNRKSVRKGMLQKETAKLNLSKNDGPVTSRKKKIKSKV